MNNPPSYSPAPRRKTRRPILIGGGLLAIVAIAVIGVIILTSNQPSGTPPPTATLPASSGTATSAFSRPVSITLTPPTKLSDLATQFPKLADILSDPELNSAYKDFLVAYQQGGPNAAIDLARKRGLLTEQNEIIATLILDADYTPDLIAQLEGVGAIIDSAYKTQVDIAVPIALIQKSVDAGDPGAVFAQLTELKHVIRIQLPNVLAPNRLEQKLRAGTITGQGVQLIGADVWQAAGLTGAGVKVGILDCGFKDYEALLGTELPATVVAKTFAPRLSDPNRSREEHGTAVAEIVHEIAPDARLFLADYGCRGGAPQGKAVEWLLGQGVQIISNSTGNPAAPMDGTGWGTDLVKEAAAQGVLWVNSSGNAAEQHYRNQYTDTDGNQLNDFENDLQVLRLEAFGTEVNVTLRWDDWARVDQDFDLFLLDENSPTLDAALASSRDAQSGNADDVPVEQLFYNGLTPGDIYYVVIYAARANRSVVFDLYFDGKVAPEFSTSDHSLGSPADAAESLTVGAVDWSTDRIADYSSRGPTADGRTKPDLAAPSEVDNFTYGQFGGTSAAAPHVAGAAALVWGAFPSFNRQQVWDYLIANVVDRGPVGADNDYGTGRLQLPAPAVSAASATMAPIATAEPLVSPTPPTPLANTPTIIPPGITPTATPMISSTITPTAPSPAAPASTGVPTEIVVIGGGFLVLVIIILIVALVRRGRRPKSPLPQSPAPNLPPSYPAAPLPIQPRPQGPAPQGSAPRVSTGPIAGSPQPQSAPPATSPCPHCGKPVRIGAKFCAACGQSISAQPAPARPAQQSAMPPQRPAAPPPPPPVASSPQLPKGPAPQPPRPSAPTPPQVMTACKQCGQPLRQGAKFCAKCGTKQ